ncbi:hypothetical protein ACFPQ1_29870 [Rhodocytophaga aerolata]|nr:hypothetical protein [Rhodocytophaga aerolata]
MIKNKHLLWVSLLLVSLSMKEREVHKSGLCYYSREGHRVEGYFIETTQKSLIAFLEVAQNDTFHKPAVYELNYRHFQEAEIDNWNQLSMKADIFVFWKFVKAEKFILSSNSKNRTQGINLSTDKGNYYFEFKVKGELR